ncbi:MAG: outer membrane protein assembly factor BamC [bacterium]|nr:outer membrane protein assembly factor BamC [bacterium]
MILRRVFCLAPCLGLVVALAGCSSLFRDRASDYRMAQELPPLTLPQGHESRPIKPLYPIPAGGASTKAEWPKKFEAPQPKPLMLSAEAANTAAQPDATTAVPEKPVLTQDGNAYPVLSITGDFNSVWDRLDIALRTGNVKVDDRDQRTGLYYLDMPGPDGKKTIYQLRVTRSQSSYILALQKDDDTLAPEAMTRTLFESIVSHWPPESGEINGKARTPLHR